MHACAESSTPWTHGGFIFPSPFIFTSPLTNSYVYFCVGICLSKRIENCFAELLFLLSLSFFCLFLSSDSLSFTLGGLMVGGEDDVQGKIGSLTTRVPVNWMITLRDLFEI